MEQKIRISQCMIVKNEENNIEQALSWGKGIVWEQIVVDTGSSDQTARIAARMGARVCFYEWKNDFAAAKNFAMEQAQGDWIAFLDADEYISPEEAKRIPSMLEDIRDSGYMALMMPLVNLDDEGNIFSRTVQIRLFRNRPGLVYQGRIHENLALDGKNLDMSQVFVTGDDYTVYHTGYRQSVTGNGHKARRNRPMVEKELEQRPDDSDLMGYLADCYRAEEDYDNAIQWYERAVEVLTRDKKRYDMRGAMTFSFLMLLLGVKDQECRLREVYRLAVKGRPQEADFDYIMGKYLTCKGEYVRGIRHLEQALKLLEQRKDQTVGAYMAGQLAEAWELMALCQYNTGNLPECARRCTGLLGTEPYRMSVLKLLLMSFKRDEEQYREQAARGQTPPVCPAGAGQVLGFLGKLYDFGGLKERLFILKGARETGYGELVQLLRSTFSPEELVYLDQSGLLERNV